MSTPERSEANGRREPGLERAARVASTAPAAHAWQLESASWLEGPPLRTEPRFGEDAGLELLHGPELRREPEASAAAVIHTADADSDSTDAERNWWWLGTLLVHLLLAILLKFAGLVGPTLPPQPEQLEVFSVDASALPKELLELTPPPEALSTAPPPPQRSPGVIVNLAPPDSPVEPPPDARFIAADDHRTEQETRARSRVQNPTVVAARASRQQNEGGGEPRDPQQGNAAEDRAVPDSAQAGPASEALPPADAARPTAEQEDRAARAEQHEFAQNTARPPTSSPSHSAPPPRLSPEQLFPSPSQMASLLGPSARAGTGAGARMGNPDDDAFDVAEGDETRLNARKDPFIAYYLQLRQQFNFYYTQACDNLRQQEVGQRLFQKTYLTRFMVIVERDGRVGGVRITQSSGVPALDGLVLEALRNASPFPAPPDGLLDSRGQLAIGGECRLGVGLGAPSFGR